MIPACQKRQLLSSSRQICRLLIAIGLPHKTVYSNHCKTHRSRPPFWSQDEYVLHDWLDLAHKAYRKSMASLHPDRGGKTEWAIRLNLAWQRIKYLFAKHGVEL